MKWIWQNTDWPDFTYDENLFSDRVTEFRLTSERLCGRIEALSGSNQNEAIIDLMLSEAIKTSAIEGEILDRDSVRSSLLSLINSDTLAPTKDLKGAGAASLLVDVRKKWSQPLSHDLLGQWQAMAVPEHRTSLILRGDYRTDPAPMQIVSGFYGRHKVHYEAPPAAQIMDEMNAFIDWYNKTTPRDERTELSGVIRAGIAHVWFETIHPFDDGNGRVGRAIADHALSQSLGYPTLACLATAIESKKKQYYQELEQVGRGKLNLNKWLEYFTYAVIHAQSIAKEEVDFVLNKTRFYDRFAEQLNERQAKVVERIFTEGRKGFEGGLSTKNYMTIAKCPNRTASRDLSDMLDKGIISKYGAGRSTRYELHL
ncbi:MAG: Fic family protein [Gammaproteobacteria bacterium]|nr:Fic family protein [Gammaproteobacteria bacterium]